MGDNIKDPKRYKTELSEYAAAPDATATGPYAKDLEVDALIVGAGFGEYDSRCLLSSSGVNSRVAPSSRRGSEFLIVTSRHLHAQDAS